MSQEPMMLRLNIEMQENDSLLGIHLPLFQGVKG
jgi:hypothetical protein